MRPAVSFFPDAFRSHLNMLGACGVFWACAQGKHGCESNSTGGAYSDRGNRSSCWMPVPMAGGVSYPAVNPLFQIKADKHSEIPVTFVLRLRWGPVAGSLRDPAWRVSEKP